MKCKYKFIHFVKSRKQNPKTVIYDVLTNDKIIESGVTGHPILLGIIKWYANWRQYGFYPESGTVFEKTCLADISDFCIELNKRQRLKGKN